MKPEICLLIRIENMCISFIPTLIISEKRFEAELQRRRALKKIM
jgi:hypothetical protein